MIGPEQKYGPFPGFVKRKEEKSPSFFPAAGIHWTGEGAKGREGDGPCRSYLEAARPDDGRGLYKAWVRGRQGSLLLGTLVPEAGGLRLRRTVSRSSLGQAGCWPVTGGNCVLTYPFPGAGGPGSVWAPEPLPERLCRDPLVKENLRGRSGFCGRRDGALCLLSAPSGRTGPFPFRFCSAWPGWRAGVGGPGWCGPSIWRERPSCPA